MPEMYFCAFAAYVILASIQAKGISVSKHRRMPPRQRTLTWVIVLELTGLFFESVNAIIFAAAGRGVGLFSFTGEVSSLNLRLTSSIAPCSSTDCFLPTVEKVSSPPEKLPSPDL